MDWLLVISLTACAVLLLAQVKALRDISVERKEKMYYQNQLIAGNRLLESYSNNIDTLEERIKREYETISNLRNQLERTEDLVDSMQEDYENKLETWKASAETEIRKDAVERAKRVAKGFSAEHFAPLMIEGLNLSDFRFIGDPIDYLIIDGGANIKARRGDKIDSIILLDIKTGTSKLSTIQRRIRDAIIQGRVKFCVYNPETDTFRTWEKHDDGTPEE